jgi:pilus assembly protein CpaB
MNRRRLLVGLAIAVVLALVASTLVYRQLRQRPVVRQVAPLQIVVAAQALPLGARLDARSVKLIPWPGDHPLPGMFTRIEEVLGRAVITPLYANEPVLESKLAPREAGAGLPAVIPEGMRAVSVAVNEVIGVAGFVQPGTMVDVLATGSPGGGGGATVTKTVLENVKVLAAGQQIQQDAEGKPHTVPVVTLLVTPADADKLTMAATQGRIQLALRNTIDTQKVNPPPVLEAELFSAGGLMPAAQKTGRPAGRSAPRVAPHEPPPFEVEIINGDKREVKTFPNQ